MISGSILNGVLRGIVCCCLFSAVISCSSVKNSSSRDTGFSGKPKVSIIAGLSSGGYIDNTELKGISGISKVDAVTGATKTLYAAGIHASWAVKGHTLESGLEYNRFEQTVKYSLPSFSVDGKRDFTFQQIRLPLTYDFLFLRDERNLPRLILKAGASFGYTFSKDATDTGNVPDYSFTDFDYGPLFGMACYPFPTYNKYRFGLFLDLYRGSRIYKDTYHKESGIGGLGFVRYGLVFLPAGF